MVRGGAGACDLCGQEIHGAPVVQTFDGQEKHFCCQGCARVYGVAHDNGMLDQVLAPQQVHEEEPASARERLGLDRLIYAPTTQTKRFSLDGMWCAGCATAAERVLRRQPGVKDVDISFAAEKGRIEFDPGQGDVQAALRALDSLGYRASLLGSEAGGGQARLEQRLLVQLIVAIAFGMQVMLLYLALLYPAYATQGSISPEIQRAELLVWVLTTPILLVGGLSFLMGAWRALRAGTASMDTLVALGILSAYTYSVYATLAASGEAYFDSVAMITVFVMLGRYLEKVGGQQARKDVRNLLRLQPERATRRRAGAWHEVDALALRPNDLILVRPGERVPADAEIIDGETQVDESMLTGESRPVSRGPSDIVYGGTLNLDGAFTGAVLHSPSEGRLAQITRLVEETLSTKPPIQRLADRASTYFAFGIIAVALATFSVRYILGRPLSQAVLNGVAVLVVACPCALGLATPLALAVSLGQSTRRGILLRNAIALETAAQVDRIVFDKTGTLTQGQMEVVAQRPAAEADVDPAALLCMAAGVEQFSEHPIGRAIVHACDEVPEADGFESLRGLGASARLRSDGERRLLVGSARLLGVDGDLPIAQEAQERAAKGDTIVWVGWGDDLAGYVALRDRPADEAHEVLGALRSMAVQPVMLSGDNTATTAAVADQLGLEEYEGDCPPAEKAERIRAWQRQGARVAMVGDGVNDAPALAQADLSITVAGGTDVAGETSDVVLTRSDLWLVPDLLRISRRTRRVILANLGWAFAYNLVSVPLAALGHISPAIAAGAMATSSLLVVGNSLRLKRLGRQHGALERNNEFDGWRRP